MLQKMFSVILLLALVITAAPLLGFTAFAETSGYLSYQKINNNTAIEISSCDTTASGSLEIPETIEGLPVTNVGENAFIECSLITSITIPDSVTSIENMAFFICPSLSAINVDPGNLNYTDIDGVLFNKAITEIVAFPGGKSGSYTIPGSVTNIKEGAFSECSLLTSVTIPDSVSSIGAFAFAFSPSLASVTIPGSVTSISNAMFAFCSALTSITIPDSVTVVSGYAFQDCSSLTSVTIGNSVLSIGDAVFYNCSSLSGLFVPDNVTDIGTRAFGYYHEGTGHAVQQGFSLYSFAGSAAEQYAIDNGIPHTLLEPLTLIDGSALTADSALDAVISQDTGLTVSYLLAEFANTGAAVYKNGEELSGDDIIGTGCEIRVMCPAGVYDVLNTAVLGDLSGDGIVDALDAFLCDKAVNGHTTLSGAYFAAANVDLSVPSLDINDLSVIMNNAVGKFSSPVNA